MSQFPYFLEEMMAQNDADGVVTNWIGFLIINNVSLLLVRPLFFKGKMQSLWKEGGGRGSPVYC